MGKRKVTKAKRASPRRGRLSSREPKTRHPVRPIRDQPFWQDEHLRYPIHDDDQANDVRGVSVDASGRVWIATATGVRWLEDDRWVVPPGTDGLGLAYRVLDDERGTVWVGTWQGLYAWRDGRREKVSAVTGPINCLARSAETLWCGGAAGIWRCEAGDWTKMPARWSGGMYGMAATGKGVLYCVMEEGVWRYKGDQGELIRGRDRLLSNCAHAIAVDGRDRVWVGSNAGLDVLTGGRSRRQFRGENGLPFEDVRAIAAAPDGETMWFGTPNGAIRYEGKQFILRHSERWVLSDDVRAIAVDSDMTAWIATSKGVSAIRRRKMTLRDKAEHYLKICRTRHVRSPGLVGRCRLADRGVPESHQDEDDDNDGQYTAMYLAAECFRYAVTGAQDAKANATEAYRALEFLEAVTPIPGFVARSVVPSTWTRMHDDVYPDEVEAAERRRNDPRWKNVNPRWHLSEDGRWWWKNDTSSDEIAGHLFGYPIYHALVADDEEKRRVAGLVRRIMDHIIDNGYVLRDVDGEPTRWAHWGPQDLNDDPAWRPERAGNSLEILSHLRVAHDLTGEQRYLDAYQRLIDEHGYAENVLEMKPADPSDQNHIQDELNGLVCYHLLRLETSPKLRKIYRKAVLRWLDIVRHESSPFYNFVCGSQLDCRFELERCVAFLRDTSLDLVEWTLDNRHRLDITIDRTAGLHEPQATRVLPASERGVIRWDGSSMGLIRGHDGWTENTGEHWLLPYWMGRYYGWIKR